MDPQTGQFFQARRFIVLICVPFLASCACCNFGPSPADDTDLDPATEAAVRRMSAKLAAADHFAFRASRTIDAALAEKTGLKPNGTVTVKVSRPDRLVGTMAGSGISKSIYFDHGALTIYEKSAGTYATVPVSRRHRDIDGAIDSLATTYGFAPPLADFVVADPFESMMRNVDSGRRVGGGQVGGATCDHFVFTGENIDWELWIARDDDLPRRFIITAKAVEGSPQLVAEFKSWDLSASHPAGTFQFSPPAGSEKIEIIPMGEVPKKIEIPSS